MSGIKRYTPDGAYWFQGGDCMDEDTDGQFVKYTDYMILLREYAEYKQEVQNVIKE